MPPVEREHGRMLAGRDNLGTGIFRILFYTHLVSRNDGGGGGSRSACHVELPNNLNNMKRSIGEIREKAGVQVQNRDSGTRLSSV